MRNDSTTYVGFLRGGRGPKLFKDSISYLVTVILRTTSEHHQGLIRQKYKTN